MKRFIFLYLILEKYKTNEKLNKRVFFIFDLLYNRQKKINTIKISDKYIFSNYLIFIW